MKKKGYFFTMDALLAILMFTTIVLLIHLFYINAPPLTQLHYLSKDTIEVLSTTKIKDLDASTYPFVGTYSGTSLFNEELTIVEQLKVYDDEIKRIEEGGGDAGAVTEKKTQIENQLLEHLYPPQYKYKIEFGEIKDTPTSEIVVVSRKLVGSVEVQ